MYVLEVECKGITNLSAICLGGKLLFSVSSCVFQMEQNKFLTSGYAVNLDLATEDVKNCLVNAPFH
jgi:hypothetical protein